MAAHRAYLDWNASAPLCQAAREAMLAAMELTGNPSSVHAEGRRVRQVIEDARRQIAGLVGAKSDQVVFTSGATEAATTLLTPEWRMGRAALTMSHLYFCETDHPCLRSGGRFAPSDRSEIGVETNGVVRLEVLERALAAHDKAAGLPLVAIHAANNETGVVQPLEAIARIVHAAGGVLVVDAVQAVGRVPIDMTSGVVDYLIITSHKIGGPKGAGAIIARADLMMPAPLVVGGGQERGFRAGTENLAAIAGFGAAAAEAAKALNQVDALAAMRDRVEAIVLRHCPQAVIHGKAAPRLVNTTFFSLPGVKAETAQIAFDLANVALSAGSACSSGKVGPSHVLQAMGLGDNSGALRISIGPTTDEADVALFEKALAGLLARSQTRAA